MTKRSDVIIASPKKITAKNVEEETKIESENNIENENALVVVLVNEKTQIHFGIHERTQSESFDLRTTILVTDVVDESQEDSGDRRRKSTPETE